MEFVLECVVDFGGRFELFRGYVEGETYPIASTLRLGLGNQRPDEQIPIKI